MNNPQLSLKTIAIILVPAFCLILGLGTYQSRRATYTTTPPAATSNTAANFARFQREMPDIEKRLVKGYLGGTGPTVRGVVTPTWFALTRAEKTVLIRAIHRRWAAINSPEDPNHSAASLGSPEGRNLAHARYNLRGQWEVVVD